MEIDDSVVIPRINSSMFREFKNRKVRVVGQVISVSCKKKKIFKKK